MTATFKTLFVTQGVTVPSSRYRVEQYLPLLRRADIQWDLRPGYGPRYNQVASTGLRHAYTFSHKVAQISRLYDVASFDAVFVQRPILPSVPLVELAISRICNNLIFDVDDAIWLAPDGLPHPTRLRAFRNICAAATTLIAGNQYIADAMDAPSKTTILPTVIDTERYVPAPRSHRDMCVGWMGTASNFPNLDLVVPALIRLLDRRRDVYVRLVSNRIFPPLRGHPRVEQHQWSSHSEVEQLQSFDIGLMPLRDTPASRGKCAFKMIQYMAVGIPTVASPVGANTEVMSEGHTGFFATSAIEWEQRLDTLLNDVALREQMGCTARTRAESGYSLSRTLPRFVTLLRRGASEA